MLRKNSISISTFNHMSEERTTTQDEEGGKKEIFSYTCVVSNKFLYDFKTNLSFTTRSSIYHITKILTKMYKGHDFESDYLLLNQKEKRIIIAIINKITERILNKRKKLSSKTYTEHFNFIKMSLTKNNYIELCKRLFQDKTPSIRRNEENIKFILKTLLNCFKHKFFELYGLSQSKSNQILFLNDFFAEHKKKYQIPVEAFSDPLSNQRVPNPYFKSIDKSYIRMIFSINSFKDKIFSFLDNQFKTVYQNSIFCKFEKKFRKMLLNLTEKKENDNHFVMDILLAKVEEDEKFKLPWIDKEIDHAIYSFKKRVQKDLDSELLISY